MAKLSFSYIPFDRFDPNTKEKVGVIFKPFVIIKIQSNHGPLSPAIDALVDSGSDRNLFPMEFATQLLGLNLKKAKKEFIRGIGNAEITGYTGKFKIWISNRSYETEAEFSSEHKIPILGRDGFFSLFKSVTFNEKTRFVDLELD